MHVLSEYTCFISRALVKHSQCTLGTACLCWHVPSRYIHLPGSLNVAMRVEAKRKEVAEARKVHELMRGPLSARPKGEEMHHQGAAWEEQMEEEGSEEDMDDMETGSAA